MTPALILIDMQRGMTGAGLGCRNNPRAEDNMALLLEHWRRTAAPIVHVYHRATSETARIRVHS